MLLAWSFLTFFSILSIITVLTNSQFPFPPSHDFGGSKTVVRTASHLAENSFEMEGDIFNPALPSDVIKEPDKIDHKYYEMLPYTNDSRAFTKHYVDIKELLNSNNSKIEGSIKNDHLTEAYRKAAGIKLKFKFPFYGHLLSNLTVATGGFLYVGDQTHSWLAATQYIAPLMANFDTSSPNSTIMYADDGDRVIIEWSKVTLRDNRKVGPFTFQVSLNKSGNITFVYKDIPLPVSDISDAHHPCKMGISDAYLFNHNVATVEKLSPLVNQNKRVIHEYHRIPIASSAITSNTVIILSVKENCLDAKNCSSCHNLESNSFQCRWCTPKNRKENAFCTDENGMNRRRQV